MASSTVMNYSNGVCVQHQMWTARDDRWLKLRRMLDVYYCSFLLHFCRKVLHIFTPNPYKLRGGKNNRSGTDYFHFTFWQKSKIATLLKFTFFKSNEAIFFNFSGDVGHVYKNNMGSKCTSHQPSEHNWSNLITVQLSTSELRMRVLYVRILRIHMYFLL